MFETLEKRLMFATTAALATVTFDGTGTLTVMGTSSADTIKVTEYNSSVTVVSGSKTLGTWPSVKTIVIHGGASNDSITFSGNTRGAVVYGDDGADTIYVTDPPVATGTSMPYSIVYGGYGNDKITVYNGVNTTVYGEAGTDTIAVSAGTGVQVYGDYAGDIECDTITVSSKATKTTVFKDAKDKLSNSSSTTLIVAV